MTTLWFIIYMTVFGWQVTQIDGHPNLQEQCHFNDRGSSFCIVSVETPQKGNTARKMDW